MSMVLVSFMVKRNHPMKVAWWGKFPAQKTHSMGNGSHENGILVQVTEVVHFHQLALSKFALFWLVLHHDLMKGFSNGIMPLCIHWSHHNKRRHDVANTTPHGERLHVAHELHLSFNSPTTKPRKNSTWWSERLLYLAESNHCESSSPHRTLKDIRTQDMSGSKHDLWDVLLLHQR